MIYTTAICKIQFYYEGILIFIPHLLIYLIFLWLEKFRTNIP